MRRRARAYYAQTPQGQKDMEERLAILWSFGLLDGSESQRRTANDLLQALWSRIERVPGFAIDKAEAASLLHRLEPRHPNAAFAVLYSLAASTTQYDSNIVSEDNQIAAAEFWRSQEHFFVSQNHRLQERMLIEILMSSYYLCMLEAVGEQQSAEPEWPDAVLDDEVPF